MKHRSDFKWSRSRPEVRVRNVAKNFDAIRCQDDAAVCLQCGAFQKLRRSAGSLYLPIQCASCRFIYEAKFQFCVPDLVLVNQFNGPRHGAVLVNEEWAHGKNRQVQRDAHQIELLRKIGYGVFVLKDTEIDNMTDSSIRAWLLGVFRSLESQTLPEYLYYGEKEYRCLDDP